MTGISRKRESGAVSLFIVIFAMLIITVLTVSFLRIMMTDQQQASQNDLSASALDSAQAGVEDAKRALINYTKVCSSSQTDCATLRRQLSSDTCNKALTSPATNGVTIADPSNVSAGTNGNPGEVMVQQSQNSANDSLLQQAYTCVKIQMATDRYESSLAPQDAELIPLVSDDDPNTGQPLPFNQVTIRWFNYQDVTGDQTNLQIPSVAPSDAKPLLQSGTWKTTVPPIMRVQLMQFGTNFTLDQFDTVSGNQSNADTVFLYPSSSPTASPAETFLGHDFRRPNPTTDAPAGAAASHVPIATQCTNNISSGIYACAMTLTLPDVIGGGNRNAYLRLTSLYNKAHFEVQLVTSTGNIVKFRDVQPSIDSTGRANDLFRRVVTKVNLKDTGFPYPDATLDVTGNLCKDFSVTDTNYYAGNCTP